MSDATPWWENCAWQSTGDGRSARVPAEDRFWARVTKTDDCWLWTGKLDRHGYGVFHVGTKHVHVHRFSYELLVGPIPDGLVIDHLCFTPACVRSDHLRPLDAIANSRRQRSAAVTECKNGHPYDLLNTYIRPTGRRDCRACIRERQRRCKFKAAA